MKRLPRCRRAAERRLHRQIDDSRIRQLTLLAFVAVRHVDEVLVDGNFHGEGCDLLLRRARATDVRAFRQGRQRFERQIRMALEALRLRNAVRFASVVRSLELRDELGVVLGAHLLGHLGLAENHVPLDA